MRTSDGAAQCSRAIRASASAPPGRPVYIHATYIAPRNRDSTIVVVFEPPSRAPVRMRWLLPSTTNTLCPWRNAVPITSLNDTLFGPNAAQSSGVCSAVQSMRVSPASTRSLRPSRSPLFTSRIAASQRAYTGNSQAATLVVFRQIVRSVSGGIESHRTDRSRNSRRSSQYEPDHFITSLTADSAPECSKDVDLALRADEDTPIRDGWN